MNTKNITAEALAEMTIWAETATLPQLLLELRKVSAKDPFAESNREAGMMLSDTIIRRFDA